MWLQYGLHSEEAEKISKNSKMQYVSDKCIKQEYQKIFEKSNPFPCFKKLMKKIFIVYGHYNDQSFNAAIKSTFIKTSEEKGIKLIVWIFIRKNLIQFFQVKNPTL